MIRSLKLLLLTLALAANAQAQTPAARTVDARDIADGMSVEQFRAYGKTSPASVRTRIGQLDFTEGGFAGGYATRETADKLNDEMDFQRATQVSCGRCRW